MRVVERLGKDSGNKSCCLFIYFMSAEITDQSIRFLKLQFKEQSVNNHQNGGALIIAGASQGLGKILAQYAYSKNYPLALVARNQIELNKINDKLKTKNNPNAISIHAVDLTKPDEVLGCFKKIIHIHKKIRALVNCAATWTGGKSVSDLSIEEMHESLMLNFFSCLHPIKALINLPRDLLTETAAIINVGATASLRGSKNCSAFAVAKGALRQLSQSLAKELGPTGIHIAHLVIDGLIDNPRTRSLNPSQPSDKFINVESISKTILMLIEQEKSCWSFEIDIRPFNEQW